MFHWKLNQDGTTIRVYEQESVVNKGDTYITANGWTKQLGDIAPERYEYDPNTQTLVLKEVAPIPRAFSAIDLIDTLTPIMVTVEDQQVSLIDVVEQKIEEAGQTRRWIHALCIKEDDVGFMTVFNELSNSPLVEGLDIEVILNSCICPMFQGT